MELIGYIASIFVGISLGLIGGGGSILVVPILIYLFNIDVVLATAYSLFIVGASSSIGAVSNYFKGLVDVKTGIVFGIPAIAAVYFTRKVLVPLLPDIFFQIGNFEMTKDLFLLILFAIVMIAASVSMIKGRKEVEESNEERKFNYPVILIEGVVVGVLTGLIGAGGGFIIIPALVILSKLPMKQAIGTSLMIISLKSLIGFTGDIGNLPIDWQFLGTLTVLAIVGIFIGMKIGQYIPGKKLKPAFGWFVLVMGMYILIKELFF